jgi:hypothetical protein
MPVVKRRARKGKRKERAGEKECSLNQEKAALYDAPAAGPASARNAEKSLVKTQN